MNYKKINENLHATSEEALFSAFPILIIFFDAPNIFTGIMNFFIEANLSATITYQNCCFDSLSFYYLFTLFSTI